MRASGLRARFLRLVGGRRTRQHAELGKFELEVDVAEVVDGSIAEGDLLTGNGLGICHQGDSRLVLIEFGCHPINLGTQPAVLVVGGLGCLLQLFDLGLEVLEMPLLALSESTLCRSVLSLALL